MAVVRKSGFGRRCEELPDRLRGFRDAEGGRYDKNVFN